MTSLKHTELKYLAVDWLQSQGYEDIELEVHVLQKIAGRKPGRGSFKIDVVGRKDGKRVAVECGGSKDTKLAVLATLFHEIYILPYGSTEPYTWEWGMQICGECGNLTSFDRSKS